MENLLELDPATTGGILIVDDSSLGRKALEEVLFDLGQPLWFATSGAEALALVPTHLPDVVLLDVMMPGMDGFEACRRLRALPRLAEIPILLITALDDAHSKLRGLEAGADDFISKPFNRAELRARLKTILRLNRYRKLWAERSKLEQLTALSPDGVVVADLTGQVLFANAASRRLLDWPPNRPLVGEDLSPWLPRAAWASATGHPTRTQTICTMYSGGTFPAEVLAHRINWDADQVADLLIVRDDTERQQLLAELHTSNLTLQELSHRLVETQEAERRFLAIELHDAIGQTLTGLKLLLEASTITSGAESRAKQADALTLTRDLLGRVRELSLNLRPSLLDDLGLFPALGWLCERFQHSSQLPIEPRFDALDDRRFAPAIELAAFRIVQEALTNVARHAQATAASVTVQADAEKLAVVVQDNGRGFIVARSAPERATSIGLVGMQERARVVGGTVSITSHPAQGTQVAVQFPLEAH